jgi:Flp pilus assembly protein TadD
VWTVRPATFLAFAVMTAVVAIEWSDAGIGLLGALVGAVITTVAVKVGVIAGASKVRKVIVGLGPRLADWHRLVIRAFPVSIAVEAAPGRRPRVVGAVFGLAAVLMSVFVASGPFGVGVALGGGGALVNALLPMFRRLRPQIPGVIEVVDLVQAGRLDEAERLVGRLNAEHPRQRTVRASRVLVLEARGRYSEALTLAIGMSGDDSEEQDAAASMAAVAGLTGAAVEAGQLPAADGLPVAARALNEAIELGKPSYMMDGVRALLALLAGDPQLAVHLARLACENNDDSLSRADDLATLARAYMAAGDNSAARRALPQAERLVPWWPRVALTRRRLDLALS